MEKWRHHKNRKVCKTPARLKGTKGHELVGLELETPVLTSPDKALEAVTQQTFLLLVNDRHQLHTEALKYVPLSILSVSHTQTHAEVSQEWKGDSNFNHNDSPAVTTLSKIQCEEFYNDVITEYLLTQSHDPIEGILRFIATENFNTSSIFSNVIYIFIALLTT